LFCLSKPFSLIAKGFFIINYFILSNMKLLFYLIILISFNSIGQSKVPFIVSASNTDNVKITAYRLDLIEKQDSVYFEISKKSNNSSIEKVSNIKYKVFIPAYTYYVVLVYDYDTDYTKKIYINTGPNLKDRMPMEIDADFSTPNWMAIRFNKQTTIYEYLIFKPDF